MKPVKAVILAGGRGSRLSEETHSRPKPMVEVGGRPLIWHIMSIYSSHGINDFIVCAGYKINVIMEYFVNFAAYSNNIKVDLSNRKIEYYDTQTPPWRVQIVNTGELSMTGGRLGRVRDLLAGEELFCMTYGDGVGDVAVADTVAFHRNHGKLATMTAVRPSARFGAISIDGNRVTRFAEKSQADAGLINGGFFVLSPPVLDLIADDQTVWEADVLPELVVRDELRAWIHEGFWYPMDTLRDKNFLDTLWSKGDAAWKTWA